MFQCYIYDQIPKRYILSLLGFLGFFNAFMLRANLSIGIVGMITPTIDNSSTNMTRALPTVFNWSMTTQGYILSSFFYGYTFAQIPAGFLAIKFGGRLLFGGGIGICAFLTLFTPLCAQGGAGALIFLRILEGFSSSFIYSSSHAIWSKWAPKTDKSKLVTFSFSGAYIGTFVTMLFGGVIAAELSWEWVFYFSGILGIIWSLLWFYATTESPENHATITLEELQYIKENIYHDLSTKDTIPWKDILTSLPVWAIIAAHFGTNWSIYTMFTELPTFLVKALGYPVDAAGFLSSLPWLPLALSVYIAGFFSDKLTKRYSTLYVRKLIIIISFVIITLGFIVITILDVQYRGVLIIFVMIVIGSCGPSWASFGVNHLDIGGYYAPILMAMSNCIGSMPGFIVPIITGYIVEDAHMKNEWNGIFIIPIFISVAALFFYSFFAAGELQSWASNNNDEYQPVPDTTEQKDSNENNIDDITVRLKAELHDKQDSL